MTKSDMAKIEAMELAKQAGIDKWWNTPNSSNECYEKALAKLVQLATNAALERAAAECEMMIMYPRGKEESAKHHTVWDAAKAIRSMKEA